VDRPVFHLREAGAALWDAKWDMLDPGSAHCLALLCAPTTVEARRADRHLRAPGNHGDSPAICIRSKTCRGNYPVPLAGRRGIADPGWLGFTHYLWIAQLPRHDGRVATRWWLEMALLLGLNVVLAVRGRAGEIYAAIIVVVPLLGLGVAFGLAHPLGHHFPRNMELGFLCPPVGLNLLLSSYRFNKPMAEAPAHTPMLLLLLLGVLLITYSPRSTTSCPICSNKGGCRLLTGARGPP